MRVQAPWSRFPTGSCHNKNSKFAHSRFLADACARYSGSFIQTRTVKNMPRTSGAFDVHRSTSSKYSNVRMRPLTPPPRRRFFIAHSNCKTSVLLRNPVTWIKGRHGRYRFVYRAPPTISPLCWRRRRAKLLVMPTYVNRSLVELVRK